MLNPGGLVSRSRSASSTLARIDCLPIPTKVCRQIPSPRAQGAVEDCVCAHACVSVIKYFCLLLPPVGLNTDIRATSFFLTQKKELASLRLSVSFWEVTASSLYSQHIFEHNMKCLDPSDIQERKQNNV